MEKDRIKKYVEGLEQTINENYLSLKKKINQFQEMCHNLSLERYVSQGMILDIQDIHKEILHKLKKIQAIQQFLQEKYRQYYRRDPLREKEIIAFGFLVKKWYGHFDNILKRVEARKVLESEGADQGESFPWFRDKENQVMLLRTLRALNDLDYETPADSLVQERREVMKNRLHSLSLFVFSGDVGFIDNLQSRTRLRDYDIVERYDKEELRGVLTHLKEIPLPEVEKLMSRLMESSDSSKLKCLLFSIQSPKDLQKEALGSTREILHQMSEGEMRPVSV